MSHMFEMSALFNQPLFPNVSSVTNMQSMFKSASSFNHPSVGSWDVSSVISMDALFGGFDFTVLGVSSPFNQNIESWNVGSATSMAEMFLGASNFNQPLDGWNVSSVASMNRMFRSASAFNQNIESWNVRSVTSMFEMFQFANAFNQPIGNWNVTSLTDMQGAFYQATSFNQDLCPWGEKLPLQDFNMDWYIDEEFFGTSCPLTTTPNISAVPPGPLCHSCELVDF